MSPSWWIALGLVLPLLALGIAWVSRPMKSAAREARLARARRSFHMQRERLEMKFIYLAAEGASQGPHWDECDFDDDVAYVRHRTTGQLSAFVGVTVPINQLSEDAGINSLLANLREGTAIFRFDRNRWETEGKALLNLSPDEAIRYYQNDLEVVDQELAPRV